MQLNEANIFIPISVDMATMSLELYDGQHVNFENRTTFTMHF